MTYPARLVGHKSLAFVGLGLRFSLMNPTPWNQFFALLVCSLREVYGIASSHDSELCALVITTGLLFVIVTRTMSQPGQV